jgi:fluoride exporter
MTSRTGIIGAHPLYVNLLLVAIGGAIGSVARYLLSTFVLRVAGTLFPLGTFVVNAIGCLVFGLIAGAADQRVALSPEARAFLLIGILGGFTTFSSYAYESFALIRDGQILWATINLAAQAAVGVVSMAIGFAIMR